MGNKATRINLNKLTEQIDANIYFTSRKSL
jgi:hypothetical protein